MKAYIREIIIDYGDDSYRVNIYGKAEWGFLTFGGWDNIETSEIPKEVKQARSRAQSA